MVMAARRSSLRATLSICCRTRPPPRRPPQANKYFESPNLKESDLRIQERPLEKERPFCFHFFETLQLSSAFLLFTHGAKQRQFILLTCNPEPIPHRRPLPSKPGQV